MKLPFLSIFLLLFSLTVTACATKAMSSPMPESLTGQDQASLIKALQAAGATVETGDSIPQDFFSVEGQTIKVNGADLQVFQYENAEAMERDASKVAPNGGSIGTSMVNWIDTPHFYKTGRIIVLYLGNDQALLDLLKKVIGPQFAGQ